MSFLKYLFAYPRFKHLSLRSAWEKEANRLIKQLERPTKRKSKK